MFNNPLTTDQQITICGANFPEASDESKNGKIVLQGKDNGDHKKHMWKWAGETGSNCDNSRYQFNEMIIALKTKNKGGKGTKELKDLVTKLELYKSGGTRGAESFEIQESQLNNALNGGSGQCVDKRIGGGTTTNWEPTSNDFSKFINPRLGLKSVQCKSGTSAEVEN